MSPVSDFHAVYVKHPQKAAGIMHWHRKRAREIDAGGRCGKYETAEEHKRLADRYEQALRATGLCLLQGCHLEDELSVWRGYGPDCWAKLTDAERAAAEAKAEALNGPRSGAAVKAAAASLGAVSKTAADVAAQLAGLGIAVGPDVEGDA